MGYALRCRCAPRKDGDGLVDRRRPVAGHAGALDAKDHLTQETGHFRAFRPGPQYVLDVSPVLPHGRISNHIHDSDHPDLGI